MSLDDTSSHWVARDSSNHAVLLVHSVARGTMLHCGRDHQGSGYPQLTCRGSLGVQRSNHRWLAIEDGRFRAGMRRLAISDFVW